VIVGVIGIAVFPNLSAMESENIVPLLLNEAASKSSAAYVFGEILIIAVVAATLSTAGVVIFALGQILAQDIYIKFVNPKATESRTILVSKVLMIGLAILGYIIVMSPRLTIWRWIELKFEIGMQAVPAIIFGLYLPWINKKGVGAGIAVGVITVVVLTLLGLPKIGGFHSGVIGFIINVILVLIISYITQKEGEVRKAEDIISETSI
jgi:Na+/proline symporter